LLVSIGWAMRGKPDQQLTLAALAMAVRQCRVQPGLIHQSDRGAQYSCGAYQQQLSTLGIRPSMSRKANCYYNAVAESFFSTLKNELVHQHRYHSQEEAGREIFAFINGSIIASGSIRVSDM
jgi:putative transposase